jgi:hypothetical protein
MRNPAPPTAAPGVGKSTRRDGPTARKQTLVLVLANCVTV